jgi:hypothetical protein
VFAAGITMLLAWGIFVALFRPVQVPARAVTSA